MAKFNFIHEQSNGELALKSVKHQRARQFQGFWEQIWNLQILAESMWEFNILLMNNSISHPWSVDKDCNHSN